MKIKGTYRVTAVVQSHYEAYGSTWAYPQMEEYERWKEGAVLAEVLKEFEEVAPSSRPDVFFTASDGRRWQYVGGRWRQLKKGVKFPERSWW